MKTTVITSLLIKMSLPLMLIFSLSGARAHAAKPYRESGQAPTATASNQDKYWKEWENHLKNKELNAYFNKAKVDTIALMTKAGIINNPTDSKVLMEAKFLVYENKGGDTLFNHEKNRAVPMRTNSQTGEVIVDGRYLKFVMDSNDPKIKNIFYAEIGHELTHVALAKIGGIEKQGDLGEGVGTIMETLVYNAQVADGEKLEVASYAELYLQGYKNFAKDAVELLGANPTFDDIHNAKNIFAANKEQIC